MTDTLAQDIVEGRITASRERAWTRSGSASTVIYALSETGRATSNVVPLPVERPFGDDPIAPYATWFGG
jgi:hypothetical protein